MNCICGTKQGVEANQRREFSTGSGEKRTFSIKSETQSADARRIVQRQHIVNFVIWLLSENLFTNGTLNQDATPAVRPAILNCTEKRRTMMRAALQWKCCGINGKGVITVKPFGHILKRDGRATFGGMETTHKMSLPLPIKMDFQAHGLAR